MQREVIKWLQSLELSNTVQNPKRDLATGHAAAEIVSHYTSGKYINLQLLPNGASAATKRDVWLQVYNALQKLNCQTVTQQLIDAVLRREPNAALSVLECLYEHFTGLKLPMRGLDAVGTSRNAYVRPTNAASTAKLLAVADGGVPAGSKGMTPTLYDTLDKVDPMQGADASGGRGGAVAVKNPAAAADENGSKNSYDTVGNRADNVVGEGLPSPYDTTRGLQQRLALIDNDELAGGVNALQTYPRYARPTASTLVHTASGSRKDVVLDRPKYMADETQQRAQNMRITQQHAVVQRLQEECATKKRHGEGDLLSSWPALGDTNGKASNVVDEHLPLTAVYRGRFYREPEAAATKALTTGTRAAKKGKKRKSNRNSRGLAENAAETSFTAADEADMQEGVDGHAAASPFGSADVAARPLSQDKPSRTGSPNNSSSAVPKLRVKVHSPALKSALALRSGSGQLRGRAAALSRELFAMHHYHLRPALSEILADILAAHKQLEHLLDCCSEDGSGEVLENVLGHMLSHRQVFPLSCMKACWESLNQHVDGIVATLQNTPDEYGYFLEAFAFAFTREAAQVPLLEPPPGSSSTTTVMDGYCSGGPRAEDQEDRVVTQRTPASATHCSLDVNATAATRRVSEAETRASIGNEQRLLLSAPALALQQQQRPSLLTSMNTRQQLDVVSVFHLFARVARQLDVPTASYLLRRYVLRVVKPFLLRHGSAAVQEAVARVVSATFVPAAPSTENMNNTNFSVSFNSASATCSEGELVTFLTSELAACVQVPPLSISSPPHGELEKEKTKCLSPKKRAWASLQQRQRVYWHVFQKSVADFPSAESHDETVPVPPTVEGPLARCVYAAAMTCLDSREDVEVATVGVRLVVECCKRWWKSAKGKSGEEEESSEQQDASGRLTREALRELIFRVLISRDTETTEEEEAKEEGGGAIKEQKAVWWNLQVAEAWELRLMVLHLCTTVLLSSLRDSHACNAKDAEGCADNDEGVYRAADDAAALCLSTFTTTASAASASHTVPLWQLQLALASAGAVVDPTRTPSLTAAWRQLVTAAEPTPSTFPFLSSIIIPNEGLAVELLLAPLQAFGGAKAFVPLKPQFRPSSAVALSSQGMESVLSTNQPLKGHLDSRVANAASRRGSVLCTRTQRNTTIAGMGDNDVLLSGVAFHNSVTHLVRGRVQSVYAVVPLYQTWNTHGVVEAMLSPLTSTEGDNRQEDMSFVQLQVVLAALASSVVQAKTHSVKFWCAVMRRLWPFMQAKKPSKAALEASGVHPPQFLQPQQIEDAQAEVMAVLLVGLFLRCADGTSVASAVTTAENSWQVLCEAAQQWMEAAVNELDGSE